MAEMAQKPDSKTSGHEGGGQPPSPGPASQAVGGIPSLSDAQVKTNKEQDGQAKDDQPPSHVPQSGAEGGGSRGRPTKTAEGASRGRRAADSLSLPPQSQTTASVPPLSQVCRLGLKQGGNRQHKRCRDLQRTPHPMHKSTNACLLSHTAFHRLALYC